MLSFLKTNNKSAAPPVGWAARLKAGLGATRDRLTGGLGTLFAPGRKVDEALYEELESALLQADVGIHATTALLTATRETARRGRLTEASEIRQALKQALLDLLQPLESNIDLARAKPFVILMTGVNGAGKTTSIGKLAKHFQNSGQSVMLAAGDTFRAAAREQLKVWGERNSVTVISQETGDMSAVVFDAVQSAKAKQIDVLIADTAGRLPTQNHLMEELRKVKRVLAKAMPDAPHEVLLILDANTGQNALAQMKSFDETLGITGLILTKLDGTARGGTIAAIAKTRPVPLYFVGVGEGIDDLQPFRAKEFVDALFD
jgi:fused signal recognition particle receptor